MRRIRQFCFFLLIGIILSPSVVLANGVFAKDFFRRPSHRHFIWPRFDKITFKNFEAYPDIVLIVKSFPTGSQAKYKIISSSGPFDTKEMGLQYEIYWIEKKHFSEPINFADVHLHAILAPVDYDFRYRVTREITFAIVGSVEKGDIDLNLIPQTIKNNFIFPPEKYL